MIIIMVVYTSRIIYILLYTFFILPFDITKAICINSGCVKPREEGKISVENVGEGLYVTA